MGGGFEDTEPETEGEQDGKEVQRQEWGDSYYTGRERWTEEP